MFWWVYRDRAEDVHPVRGMIREWASGFAGYHEARVDSSVHKHDKRLVGAHQIKDEEEVGRPPVTVTRPLGATLTVAA